jgi:hypothetical protein
MLRPTARHGRNRSSSAPPPAMASTRAQGPDCVFGPDCFLFFYLETRLLFIFYLGTQLLSAFLSKDLCVKVSILNSPKQPNNIPTQLASTNPGYQTHEKI